MKEAKEKEVVDLEGRTKKVLDNMAKSFERMRDEANSLMMGQDKYWAHIMKGVKEEAQITDRDLLLAGMPAPLVMEVISLEEQPATKTSTYKTVYLKKKDGSQQSVPFDKAAKDITPYSKAFEGNGVKAMVMGDPDAILKVFQKLYGDDIVQWSVPAEESAFLFPSLQAAILTEMYNVVKFQKESALFELKEAKLVVKEDAAKRMADAFDKEDRQELLDLFPNVIPDYPMQLVQETKTVLNLLSSDEMARLFPNINSEYLVNLKESELEELANQMEVEMARGNAGRGSRGACGGTRRRDGSGGGVGNRGTKRQPKKKKNAKKGKPA